MGAGRANWANAEETQMTERWIESEFVDAIFGDPTDQKNYKVYARPLPPGLSEIVYVSEAPEGYKKLSTRLVPTHMITKI